MGWNGGVGRPPSFQPIPSRSRGRAPDDVRGVDRCPPLPSGVSGFYVLTSGLPQFWMVWARNSLSTSPLPFLLPPGLLTSGEVPYTFVFHKVLVRGNSLVCYFCYGAFLFYKSTAQGWDQEDTGDSGASLFLKSAPRGLTGLTQRLPWDHHRRGRSLMGREAGSGKAFLAVFKSVSPPPGGSL